MNSNNKNLTIEYLQGITKCKKNSIEKQFKEVPNFWQERFIKDGWRIEIVNRIPRRLKSKDIMMNLNEQKMLIEVKGFVYYKTVIYKAFGYYVQSTYAKLDHSTPFARLYFRNKSALIQFMKNRKCKSKSLENIFVEIFSFVLETKGKNTEIEIDEIYQYMKKWVDGSIYERNIKVPNYIDIINCVTDEQIQKVEKAFKRLPIKLKKEFIKENWKIKILSGKLDAEDCSTLCRYDEKIITIMKKYESMYKTTLFELGYFFDYKESFISNSERFKEIHNNEEKYVELLYKNLEEDNCFILNCNDYFSEIFRLYMTIPRILKGYAPESYEFMKKIVDKWL